MAEILLLADMNISPQTVARLQAEGWDAVRVSTLLPVDASDQEVLELARQQGRVVVTQDLDFSTLLALGGFATPSLITFRLSDADPEEIAQRLIDLLPQAADVLQEGCAITITDNGLRVRRLPIR